MSNPNPFINPRQVPDKAIIDAFGKQTYVGNGFVINTDLKVQTGTDYEVPFLLLSNPAANAGDTQAGQAQSISAFQNLKKMICHSVGAIATFKFYLNPTAPTGGTTLTPVNLRSGGSNTSKMTCKYSPTIAGVAQVQTVDTVPDVTGSLNNTYFLLSDINPPNAKKLWYMWFNVNNAGTDPAVSGRSGIEVHLATNATANAVATAMRSALNALSSDFVASGSTSHVIITSVNAGASDPAQDGAQATGFTFHNTTPGSVNFGTLLTTIAVSITQIDSDLLFILDPGSSLLVTTQVDQADTEVAAELAWYEI